MKKLLPLLFTGALFAGSTARAQLFISSGSTFTIQSGGVVTVQGDVTSNVDILGGGKLLLKGTANQNLNTNGFIVPNLEMDNAANATLTGNTKIGSSLLFTNGKIVAGNFNLRLADVASSTGMGTNKFVETNGTGQVIKEISANLTSNEIPVGAGSIYRPAFITSSGTYSSAAVGIRSLAVVDPNRPVSVSDYLNAYWPVTRTGITGTLTVGGQYDNTDIAAGSTEANLRGYYFNATDWSSAGETHDATLNRVAATVSGATGDVTGIDKFNLIGARAYLQGAYSGSGIMADNLRAGTNLIPLADPYRNAPYSSSFTHSANNTLSETASAAIFTDQAITSNNIVDWVFLELRNTAASPGNAVLQTRSALLQRDGDIVDVDGISPVTFNNVANGNYTLVVRHRNHLGLSTDPATYTPAFGEAKSALATVDFGTQSDANLFGTSAAFTVSGDGRNLLWGGNANFNTNTKFNGLLNDKDYLLVTSLGNNSASTLSNIYSPADVNMNRNVKYNGLLNDKDFIINTVLITNAATIRSQAIPN